MPEVIKVAVAPGVTRENYLMHYLLRGNPAQIIAAGLAKPDWFAQPGAKDKRGRAVRRRTVWVDGCRVRTHLPERGPAQVNISLSNAEMDALLDVQEWERVRNEEARALAGLPDSHAAYRKISLENLKRLMWVLRGMIEEPRGGYRYGPDVLAALDEAAADLVQILGDAQTHFDPKARAQIVAKIKGWTAKADHGRAVRRARADGTFQKFLRGVAKGDRYA